MEKFTIDYKLPSEILKELKISRHEWLKLYYTNREEEKERFNSIMEHMENSIICMEREMITNPYRRESLIHILEYWFPDLYSKVKFNIGAKKKEDKKILEDAINKSDIEL